jgi:catechol 2,3-dioxygenase-like lactoylglutathione lyase family enzyme
MGSQQPRGPALGAFAHATLGVASLDEAIAFWTGHFGFEIAARSEGADADLAALWNIAPSDIARQALVQTPQAAAGALHLVQFAKPGAPVRRDAQAFDHLPKNLDLYVRDMAARFETLKAAGVRFRSDPITSPGPDGLIFKEVHMAGHDDTNIVLLEIIGKGYDTCFNAKGFAGIGPLITIVPDLAAEEAFYTGILGMAITLDIRLGGPVMEKMIGLPTGAALVLKVYGDPAEPLGRVEVIQYERTSGANLFPRARAPALGTLHVTYQVEDLAPLLERLDRGGVAVEDHGRRRLIYGVGRVVSFRSPAGFRLEAQERRTA